VAIQSPDADSTEGVPACVRCGDCFTGCNHGSKLTLAHNYLRLAHENGAAIYSGALVQRLQHGADTGWAVDFSLIGGQSKLGEHREFTLTATHVILAAGVFGSTEILQRSSTPDLRFSPQLGQRFSTNGDALTTAYDTAYEVNSIPDEEQPLEQREIGPTITSIIDCRNTERLEDQLVIEELSPPAALGEIFAEIVTTARVPHDWARWDLSSQSPAMRDPAAVDPAAIRRTILLSSMGHDSASGQLRLAHMNETCPRDGRLTVHWPTVGDEAFSQQSFDTISDRWKAGGTLIPNPLWKPVPDFLASLKGKPDKRVFTTHPLGGCAMGKDSTEGAVNAFGQVFDGGAGISPNAIRGEPATYRAEQPEPNKRLHAGLYVLDGSIIPRSLGINPLLTITAVVEGCIDAMIARRGLRAPGQPRPIVAQPVIRIDALAIRKRAPTRMQMIERMKGSAKVRGHMLSTDLRAEFDPIEDLRAFVQADQRKLGLTARLSVQDGPLGTPAVVTLKGTVWWMEVEASGPILRTLRALWAYRRNRLCADWQSKDESGQTWWQLLSNAVRSASRIGQVRHLRYAFEPLTQALPVPLRLIAGQAAGTFELPAGTVLAGCKRLGYFVHGNPLRQLSEMDLIATLPNDKGKVTLAHLEYDQLFGLDRYETPIKLLAHDNGSQSTKDLTRLGLYLARVITGVHFWSFRAPDYTPRTPRCRMPEAMDGIEGFEQFSIKPDLCTPDPDDPLRLGLTHYPAHANATCAAVPVLMIHGFGSGGVQFTSNAIPLPMAKFLHNAGHDVWVADLRTSIGMTASRRQWSMDEVALNDVCCLVDAVLERSGATQLDIVAHCIGSAMFCMAALGGRLRGEKGQSLVRRALLMQVGPIIVLPNANKARAYVGRRIAQASGATMVDSSVDSETPKGEVMMDRLLAAYPYPAKEAAQMRLTGDMAANRLLGSANRSAGVFGQLFERRNMAIKTLAAFGDLLGHCNLKTYRQTLHYTYVERLTNAMGNFGDDGDLSVQAYVTDDNVASYLDFPLLFLHGSRNQVFSPHTTARSRDYVNRLTGQCERRVIKGYGHLDCVVGQHAETDVFPHIAEFLDRADQEVPARNALQPERITLAPEIGPWLGWTRIDASTGALLLRIGVRPSDRLPGAQLLMTAVSVDGAAPLPSTMTLYGDGHTPPVINGMTPPHGAPPNSLLGTNGIWVIDVAIAYELWRTAQTSLAVWVNGAYQGVLSGAMVEIAQQALPANWQARYLQDWIAERIERLDQSGLDEVILDAGLLQGLARPDFSFFLGSCRQSPGPFDRGLADRAMRQMLADMAAANQSETPARLALLVGDQIYADSTAGVFDASNPYDQYVETYREAWTAPAQRDLMRRLPVYMAMDDHEFRDNFGDAQRHMDKKNYGVAARSWHLFELAAGPLGTDTSRCHYQFETAGARFFVVDTRNERVDAGHVQRGGARIMMKAQWLALEQWLADARSFEAAGGRAFLVSPVPVAPWLTDGDGKWLPAVASDNWQRYPVDVSRLLKCVYRARLEHLTILSGDFHLFVDARIHLQRNGGAKRTIRQIVCPGLYSPFRFANVDATLVSTSRQNLGALQVEFEVCDKSPANGFVQLDLVNGNLAASLRPCG
jgi:hypothetical protein